MKDLTSLKTDFRDWLTLPITKTFVEILTSRMETMLDHANQSTYQTYYKKELSDQVTLAYGKADGIQTILSLMEDCKDDKPETKTINGEEITTYPTIDDLFQQTFEPEND